MSEVVELDVVTERIRGIVKQKPGRYELECTYRRMDDGSPCCIVGEYWFAHDRPFFNSIPLTGESPNEGANVASVYRGMHRDPKLPPTPVSGEALYFLAAVQEQQDRGLSWGDIDIDGLEYKTRIAFIDSGEDQSV